MDTAEKYERQLLEQTRAIYNATPIADATARAYLATPRHSFVKRYREGGTKARRCSTGCRAFGQSNTLSQITAPQTERS